MKFKRWVELYDTVVFAKDVKFLCPYIVCVQSCYCTTMYTLSYKNNNSVFWYLLSWCMVDIGCVNVVWNHQLCRLYLSWVPSFLPPCLVLYSGKFLLVLIFVIKFQCFRINFYHPYFYSLVRSLKNWPHLSQQDSMERIEELGHFTVEVMVRFLF